MRRTHRPLTLTAILLSLFMAAIEATVVSTAMPTVVGDLGGVHLYAWVFTAYLLSSTITVPIFGKLADLYGRKPILLVGTVLFTLGSVACGLSTEMLQLVICRAFQGLGAGALQPITLTVVGDIYSLEERARIQGLTGAVWGVSGLLGPMVGGYLTEWLSWHWIFFLNVPFGVLAGVLFALFFHEGPTARRKVPLDLPGAALLGAGLLLLLLATERPSWGIWPYLVVAAIAWLFVWVERRAEEPILPPALFSRPAIATTAVATTFFGATVLATTTYVPLYLQAVSGASAAEAGRAITPMLIGWPLFSTISGRVIPRIGFRLPVRLGYFAATLAACGLALHLGSGEPTLLLPALMFLLGCGLGFANTGLILLVQTSVPWELRGVATASTMFFRTIGGAVAVAAVGSLLVSRLARVPSATHAIIDSFLGPTHGEGMTRELLESLGAALAEALTTGFWIVAALTAAGFFVAIFFPADPITAARAKRER
ncbi:MAG: MDR family MFS transporter [Pseudomonadota bacterium]|nr:MAG: MFS transporter [Pseudomonadota bacterium]